MEGKVFVTFVLEIDGSLSQIKVVKGVSGKYDEAALKVFKNMLSWEPGSRLGQPVRVRMIISITFCPQ
jgi:protein TonB